MNRIYRSIIYVRSREFMWRFLWCSAIVAAYLWAHKLPMCSSDTWLVYVSTGTLPVDCLNIVANSTLAWKSDSLCTTDFTSWFCLEHFVDSKKMEDVEVVTLSVQPKAAWSGWGSTPACVPCSLEDVMSHELAMELQNQEEKSATGNDAYVCFM